MLKIILTTTDNEEIKNKIVFSLLEKKLAACIQVKEIYSFYLWKGEVEKGKEVLLIIKTLPKLERKVIEEKKKLHNYEIPEIIILDGKSSEKYIKWMEEVLK
jgi:periplasmic divalent cation tolerance protein